MIVLSSLRELVATFLVSVARLDTLALELKIANSRVMGASAVNTTVTLMGLAGAAQVLGVGGSDVLSQFGGKWLDLLWSGALVLAWVLVVIARWREKKDVVDAAWLEIGGILLISAVFILFTVIVIKYAGGSGALFLTCAFLSQCLTLLGRGALLLRRIVWLGRAAKR